jgi:hypothetical protein
MMHMHADAAPGNAHPLLRGLGRYENPKMTVPDLYHVQVFWHKVAR